MIPLLQDNEALDAYLRKDDGKVKELNLQVERATREVGDLREQLQNEVTETQAAQIQLDKTAEDFKYVAALTAEYERIVAAVSCVRDNCWMPTFVDACSWL